MGRFRHHNCAGPSWKRSTLVPVRRGNDPLYPCQSRLPMKLNCWKRPTGTESGEESARGLSEGRTFAAGKLKFAEWWKWWGLICGDHVPFVLFMYFPGICWGDRPVFVIGVALCSLSTD